MAQNISVTLVLDDKQYTAKLKAAETATRSFARASETSALAANTAFTKLSNGTDLMVRRFGGLRAAIAGLGFAAMGQSALAMADDLQDLSNASGIAVGRLIELKKALTTSGGQADQMSTALNNFLRSIDEAAEGSIKAQNSFMGIGVSLNDLRRLSEQDLFMKTLEGIAAIENPSRRAAEMMDKFGKSFKTVDPQELLDKLRATRGEGDKYAETIRRAAELNDALATAQGNLKLAFLEAFSPIIKNVNEFNAATEAGSKKMESLITTIKLLGVAIATAFAVSLALGFVTTIGQVGRAVTSVIGLLGGAAAASSGLGGIFAGGSKLMVGIKGIVVAVAGIGTALLASGALFENFGNQGVIAIMKLVEAIGIFAAAMGGGAFGAGFGGALGGPIGAFIGGIAGAAAAGAGMDLLIDKAKTAREEAEKALKIGGGRGGQGGPTAEQLAGAGRAVVTTGGKGGPDAREVDVTARKNAIQGIRDITAEYEKQQRLRIAGIDAQTRMVGKTDEEKQMAEARRDLFLDYTNTFEQLEKRRLSLTKDEQYLNGEILKQQKEVYQVMLKKDEELVKAITEQQTANLLEKDRLQTIQNVTKAIEDQIARQQQLGDTLRGINDQRKNVDFEKSLMGKSPIQRQYAQIQEDARKAALEAGRAFAANFDDEGGLTAARAQELYNGLEQIAQGYRDVANAQMDSLYVSREWNTGLKEAFNTYVDSATNAAQQARDGFATFTQGMEDAFVKFVQTGKLSFSDLANSIIADLAKIVAKKAIVGFGEFLGFGGSGSVSAGPLTILSKLFGFAAGGQVMKDNPIMVGERGPELFVPKSAGTIVPNNALGQPSGNNQPAQTMVSYNIQAVDAASFRSLVARDPGFIYAVTETGRRSQPTRSR